MAAVHGTRKWRGTGDTRTADEAARVVQKLEAEGLIVPQLVFQVLFSLR